MKTAEQILDEWLTNYPWQHWSKQNAIKAMNEFAEQQVKLLTTLVVANSLYLCELEHKLDEALDKETRKTLTKWFKNLEKNQ